MPRETSVTFVLPNYRGRELLERFLPGVLAAAHQPGLAASVLVVDDASPDDSVSFLRRRFPEVNLLTLRHNVGFARAVNAGVHAATTDLVVLLNTDVAVEPGFLPPLLQVIEDPRVFAAVPRIRRPAAGGTAESAISATFERGLFRLHFLGDAPFRDHAEPFPTLYPVGAAAVIRRPLFLQLGGMDPLFRPYYWEDADLGYRAWKAGHRVLCVPASTVDHHAGVISATQPKRRVVVAQSAHRFLFTWKNIHDPGWILSHWALLGLHCAESIRRGQGNFVRSLAAAIPRLPWALRARHLARRAARVSDREVLRLADPGGSGRLDSA